MPIVNAHEARTVFVLKRGKGTGFSGLNIRFFPCVLTSDMLVFLRGAKMTYSEVLEEARKTIGDKCKACPVCNGVACKNTIPGPGAKGSGTVAIRNFNAWQNICVNMDTIYEHGTVDTSI